MQDSYRLIIGNKNYSSWSMRPWVMMRHAGLDFTETVIPLYQDDTADRLAAYSEAPAKVPILMNGNHCIWDSLAILEFLNEGHPESGFLPADREQRALARSICSEMHSGFTALRSEAPMNIRNRRRIELSSQARDDIKRIETIWIRCLESSNGDFLFGAFCMADAMYAPVVMRFVSMEYQGTGRVADYMRAVCTNAAVRQWCEEGEKEPWVIDQ